MTAYRIVTLVEVHDAHSVLAAGQRYLNEQDPGWGDEIDSVEEALTALFDPSVVPLDNGFGVISRIATHD